MCGGRSWKSHKQALTHRLAPDSIAADAIFPIITNSDAPFVAKCAVAKYPYRWAVLVALHACLLKRSVGLKQTCSHSLHDVLLGHGRATHGLLAGVFLAKRQHPAIFTFCEAQTHPDCRHVDGTKAEPDRVV